jgi:hypothetical protein
LTALTGPCARAVARAAGVALLLAAGAALAAHNLGDVSMWWDEAAQFWVSQGLSNYSSPFTPRSGLVDVARRNCWENLDPGGFSLLLHVWTVAGRGLEWLRALPFAFFLVGAAALGVLGWRLTGSAAFALAAAALPALFSVALHFAFEIRAYSMEMAGIAAGALALAAALERPSTQRSAALGLVLAGFLSSRYSYALFSVAALTGFAAGLRGRAGARERASHLAAVLLPVLLAAGLGWWVTLRHQVWPEMRGGVAGVQAPVYTLHAVLGRSGHDAALVRRNLLSPAALPLTACILFVMLVRPRAYAAVDGLRTPVERMQMRSLFTALYVSILGTLALSAVASLLGAYPWDIASRWSAYLVMVSALAVVVVAAECVALVRAASPGRAGAGTLARRLGVALALLATVAGATRAATYRYDAPRGRRSIVAAQVAALPLSAAPAHGVLVGFYEAPVLRYLYEYGPLVGRAEYPRVYRFESGPEWARRTWTDLPGEGIAFVISGQAPADARARFLGGTLRALGPDGDPPYAVVGTGAESSAANRGTEAPAHR